MGRAEAATKRCKVSRKGKLLIWLPLAGCPSSLSVLSCRATPQATSCTCCLQAVSLLADIIRDPARLWEADATRSDLQWEIWYQNSPMAELAAYAASCLIDLLLLASLKFSPMSVSAPAAFIQACEGKSHTLITLFDLFSTLSRQSMKSAVCQMHR